MAADLALVVFLAAAFLLGLLRGAVRQLIALGAWLVSFVVAAYMRGPIGDWIASQARQYSRAHVDMLSFAVVFIILLTVSLVIIELRGSTIQLTRRRAVDEVVGGFLAVGLAVLTVGALMIILDTYYAGNPAIGSPEFDVVHQVRSALEQSAIAKSFEESLVRGLIALLGPLLPSDVRAVYV